MSTKNNLNYYKNIGYVKISTKHIDKDSRTILQIP